MRLFLLIWLTLCQVSGVAAQTALIYDGPGICDGCAEDAALMLREAGLDTRLIYASDLTDSTLSTAALLVVPGGTTNAEMRAGVTEAQMQTMRDYVFSGGHYLGICLGAYFAGATLDDAGRVPGLALFKGDAYPHSPVAEQLDQVVWRDIPLMIYQQEAPAFELWDGFTGEVVATYLDGAPAALLARAGQGHIALIGPHPEARLNWLPGELTPSLQRAAFKQGVALVEDLMQRE